MDSFLYVSRKCAALQAVRPRRHPDRRSVRGERQYQVHAVAVENRGICLQGDAKLSCAGFSSAMGINPDVLSADGKLCTLNGGRPNGMGANYAIRFSYAWRSKIDLKPVSSTRK